MFPAAIVNDVSNGTTTYAHIVKDLFKILVFGALLFLSFFVLFPFLKEGILARKIQSISLEDRATLEAFFRVLILKEDGAYVLFGDKPVMYTAYIDVPHINYGKILTHRYYTENQILKKGWMVWQKYQNLFPSNRFILQCKPSDNYRFEICLIDKLKFIETIDNHLQDFQTVLGSHITSEILLNNYRKENVSLFKLLNKHEALLGILLGFGKRNAWLFHEYALQRGEDPRRIIKIPHKIGRFSTDKHTLKSAFAENNHRKCYKFLYLPSFLADINSTETRELQRHYLDQRKLIHEKYAHDPFLKVTLKKFCLNQ